LVGFNTSIYGYIFLKEFKMVDDKCVIILDGREYDVSNLIVNDKVKSLLARNPNVNSNGCGTNSFNKFFIGIVESWAKVKLIKACIVHDLSYETAEGRHEEKIRIDAEFHANIYMIAKELGVGYTKAKWVAKLFHSAVIIGGGSSFPSIRK
jgi:hypothetical protein